MASAYDMLERPALIAHLVARAPTRLGRTAVMKCMFFLKVLKRVPLPYRFTLYMYGPYDSDVLDDLNYAQALGAVESELVAYPKGRGYVYQRGPKIEAIEQKVRDYLALHEDSIDWVLSEFGGRSAGDLEMASTLVFVDRAAKAEKRTETVAELARKVHAIKPHLRIETIESEARALKGRGLLEATA